MPGEVRFLGPSDGKKLFLSYTRTASNTLRMKGLAALLQQQGFQTWLDVSSSSGGDWLITQEGAIEEAHYFLPFFCRESNRRIDHEGENSEQRREIKTALQKAAGMRNFVMPCLLEDVRIPKIRHTKTGDSIGDLEYYKLFGQELDGRFSALVASIGGNSPRPETRVQEHPESESPKEHLQPAPPVTAGLGAGLKVMQVIDGGPTLKHPPRWTPDKCLERCPRHLRFMGVFGGKWLASLATRLDTLRFSKSLRMGDGRPLQFLLANPHTRLMGKIRDRISPHKPQPMKPAQLLSEWAALQEQYPDFLKVKFYRQAPKFRLTFVDDKHLVLSYYVIGSDGTFGTKDAEGWEAPQLVCDSGLNTLFEAFDSYFNEMWAGADTLQRVMATEKTRLAEVGPKVRVRVTPTEKQKAILHGPVPPERRVFGRKKDIESLLGRLEEPSPPHAIIVYGFGGVGKSTVAACVARHYAREGGPFGHVAWIDLRDYAGEAASCAEVVQAAAQVSFRGEVSDKEHLIERWASECTLVVFDNYESFVARASEEEKGKIEAFMGRLTEGDLGETPCIRLLVTTRDDRVSGVFTELKELETDTAIAFTRDFAEKNRLNVKGHEALVFERVGGLPKYIEIAVGLRKRRTLEDWVQCLEQLAGGGKVIFDDLLGVAWKGMSPRQKHVLLAVSLFDGGATGSALRHVSGVTGGAFHDTIDEMKVAYIQADDQRHTVHPLVQEFTHKQLERSHSDFHAMAKKRFVDYHLDLLGTLTVKDADDFSDFAPHLDNVGVATAYAKELQMWDELKSFRQARLRQALQYVGRWELWLALMKRVLDAARATKDDRLAAECLVYDLTWVELRHERLERAERYANDGMGLCSQLGLHQGEAQAIRHLGKIQLLRGVYEDITPDPIQRQTHCERARELYTEAGDVYAASNMLDQRAFAANMLLDFGRLDWLQGRQLDQDRAVEFLDRSLSESARARDDFRSFGDKDGEAKALGNLGNTTKEIAIMRFALDPKVESHPLPGTDKSREKSRAMLTRALTDARRFYEDSLELAESAPRRIAEVAHANWGLAATDELLAQLEESDRSRRAMLTTAFEHAKSSRQDYISLGGGRDRYVVTELQERLERKLEAIRLEPAEAESSDFYCRKVLNGEEPVRVVHESERVLAFEHTRPSWPVHIVIIPKQHVESLLDVDDNALFGEMMTAAQVVMARVKREFGGCRLTTNVGDRQQTKHLHWHVYTGPTMGEDDNTA